MICGEDSKDGKKMKIDCFLDSVARWSICQYDFRMGCDPPFFVTRGVTPCFEIIVFQVFLVLHSLILGCDPPFLHYRRRGSLFILTSLWEKIIH